MPSLSKFLLAAGLSACALSSHAAPVIVAGTTATGAPEHDLALLTDGAFPINGTDWQHPSTVWWTNGAGPSGTVLTFEFAQTYTLQDVVLTVDNNDDYVVETSLDGSTWTALFTVAANTGPTGWGLDNFSSTPGDAAYSADIDFAPTAARFARIYALNGDALYSVGEVQFTAAVPEPGSLALLGAGLAITALGLRRRVQRPTRA